MITFTHLHDTMDQSNFRKEKKGLYDTLSDPRTSNDPDALSDATSAQNCS